MLWRIFLPLNTPGTRGGLRKGLLIPTDGLITDGRRARYLSEYVLRCKKGPLKSGGNFF